MATHDEKPWGLSEPQAATRSASKNTSRPATSRKQAVNQTLSCAECRRLKLRCDRVFPCGSCQKRGIAELCPEGSLPTRNKPVTSSNDKEQLYQRLSELRGRILELESALETAHACVSSEPHPLLNTELFMRKSLSKRRKIPNGQVDEDEHDEGIEGEPLDEAIGSLNVGEEGQASYFGRSACVERLFKYQGSSSPATRTEGNILVSAEVAMIYKSFPLLTIGEATNLVQERIWRHLPPLQRAQSLRESYCRHMYYITDIVPRDGWFSDLFSRIYKDAGPTDTPRVTFSEAAVRADELALVFAYFAAGALTDLNLTPFNYEAEAYAYLSRAALTIMDVFKNATITTIETLVILAYFEAMWGEQPGRGDAWLITTLATNLAQSLGLQRDTKKFGLEPADVKRRTKVYWELFALELIESLAHGRPSAFSMIPSDVEMPAFPDPKTDIHDFRYRLASECLAPLCREVFGLRIPSYNTVIELDRKIRKFCGDWGIGVAGKNITFSGMDETDALQTYKKLVYRESTLMYLHRSFFARAIAMNPPDPQHTKYGLSVSGAYESAMTLVQALGDLFQYHPASSTRALLCWNHTLCSVFILGSIATCSPGSRLAPLASKRLHDTYELYQRASIYGGRASADKAIVSRMIEKSTNVIQSFTTGHDKSSRGFGRATTNNDNQVTKREPEDEDELGLLGGYTRVIKPLKASASPESSIGSVQPTYARGQDKISLETGSLSESATVLADQVPRWEATNPTLLKFKHIPPAETLGPSNLGHTTDLIISSAGTAGTAASGMSPVPPVTIDTQRESYIHSESSAKLPLMDARVHQYLGAPHFAPANGLPEPTPGTGGYEGDVRVERHTGTYSNHLYNEQHVDYVPMDVTAEWNFLDDWYGHVFQLGVVPPDYGPKTSHIGSV